MPEISLIAIVSILFFCGSYVNDNNGETVIKEYKSQENAIVDDVS